MADTNSLEPCCAAGGCSQAAKAQLYCHSLGDSSSL